jgi:hypothetical protein
LPRNELQAGPSDIIIAILGADSETHIAVAILGTMTDRPGWMERRATFRYGHLS